MEFLRVNVIAPLIIAIASFFITVILLRKKRNSKYLGLDWMILLFILITLLGIVQTLHVSMPFYFYAINGEDVGLLINIPRLINYVILIIFYIMLVDSFYQSLSHLNLIVFTFLNSIYLFLNLHYMTTKDLILTQDLIWFGHKYSLAHFNFDLLQFYVFNLVLYEFVHQLLIIKDEILKKNLLIVSLGILTLDIMVSFELLEHILMIPDINAFITAIPAFILLAYFYVRYPNFLLIFMLNRCRILIMEYQISGKKEKLDEAEKIVDKIIQIAYKQNLKNLLIQSFILKSKINLLDGNIIKSKENLNTALKLSNTNKTTLKSYVKTEIAILENQFKEWKNFYKYSRKLQDRIEDANIEDYVNFVIQNLSD